MLPAADDDVNHEIISVPMSDSPSTESTPAALSTARRRPSSALAPVLRQRAYQDFWEDVGARFPDLGGATSTAIYRAGERRLIAKHLPKLAGLTVLKTDLWDEARNTRILQWVQQQGATVVGIDISLPIIGTAKVHFGGAPLGAVGADVRELPFAESTFDAIYSMGTIEHFEETEQALRELVRVLKPGGTAIIGVPNRRDPFLRPLFVDVLWRLGLYDYGFEKSFTHRQLRQMLADAGLTVLASDGLLFMPGWLRMADLYLHTRLPALAPLLRPAVRLFGALEAASSFLRRRGYLIAAIGQRPGLQDAKPPATFSSQGAEILVDALGCDRARLADPAVLKSLFAEILTNTGLRPAEPAQWHVFGAGAGVTGLQMLRESHLACHTYPEAGYAAFSLYCCRPEGIDWPWSTRLKATLGASDVIIRTLPRGPNATEECR